MADGILWISHVDKNNGSTATVSDDGQDKQAETAAVRAVVAHFVAVLRNIQNQRDNTQLREEDETSRGEGRAESSYDKKRGQ